MKNALTIDVEDYFQVAALAGAVSRADWHLRECRVERNTDRLLELLDRHRVKGTFFVLGWIAERYPQLVRRIADAGHEVASHGLSHNNIYEQTVDEFRAETTRSKRVLEDIVGRPVTGYRAASFSITQRSLWALDVLLELGFEYDSSIFPIRHDRYGIPDASTRPGRVAAPGGGEIVEFPMSTALWAGQRVPVSGGGYFRIFPYWFTRRGLQNVNGQQRQPFVFYLHPWEIDPAQPRLSVGLVSRFRHYWNLDVCERRLDRLLTEFDFAPMREVLEDAGLLVPSNAAPTVAWPESHGPRGGGGCTVNCVDGGGRGGPYTPVPLPAAAAAPRIGSPRAIECSDEGRLRRPGHRGGRAFRAGPSDRRAGPHGSARRVRRLGREAAVIPFTLESPLRTVLCLGAHCDDIEIGCGATLHRLARRHPGARFVWVVFSGEPERERETRAAAVRLMRDAACEVRVLPFRGSYLPSQYVEIKDAFETLKADVRPDLIFTHAQRDRHQDHRVVSELTWNTFRDHSILEYEIPKYEGDLGHPSAYVALDADDVDAKVDTLLECYATQRHRQWFRREVFVGLMSVRGVECASPTGYAEAFHAPKLRIF